MISSVEWITKTSYTQEVFFSQLYNITFTVNTDGVDKYSSPHAGHLWPTCIYTMINELPKEHWLIGKFLIPAYIYCGKQDQNMLTFFNPLIKKFNSLNDPRIHVPDSGHGNINVRCMLLVVTVNLPARADLMNMKRYNSKCACQLCMSEGKGYGPNNIHRWSPFQQNLKKRTHEDQLTCIKGHSEESSYGSERALSFRKTVASFWSDSIVCNWLDALCLSWSCLRIWCSYKCLMETDENRDKPFYLGAKKEPISC